MKTKKGFTLAETLIVMAILGILAAVTVPTLVTITNKYNYVNGLKSAYLILKTATSALMANNSGTLVGTFQGDQNGIASYYPYLNITKKCDHNNVKGYCWSNEGSFYFTNGTPALTSDWTYIGSDGGVVLFNGMFVNMTIWATTCNYDSNATCGIMNVDTNGFKGPNTYGRDIFVFFVTKNGLIPRGLSTDLSGLCDTTRGDNCAGRVLTEGAINY